MSKRIEDYLSHAEILAQLAEEASELAQAALKLRRVLDAQNPTPVNFSDAYGNLVEEYSDVVNCMRELNITYSVGIISRKKERWIQRLEQREGFYEKEN